MEARIRTCGQFQEEKVGGDGGASGCSCGVHEDGFRSFRYACDRGSDHDANCFHANDLHASDSGYRGSVHGCVRGHDCAHDHDEHGRMPSSLLDLQPNQGC